MDDVARVIDAPGPHDLVRAASTFVEVFRRRPLDAMTPDRTGRTVSGAEFFDALIGHNVRETTGLMTALVLLLDDEVTVARMRRELEARAHHLPRWLRMLESMSVHAVWEMTDPLGDGDNHLLDVRFASGHAMTAVVYIDHNMSTLVKDAFLVPEPLDAVRATFERHAEPGVVLKPLDPAAARARITDAIAQWDITFPPVENDTWPACRAAVEWFVRALPAGGAGYVRPEWTQADRDALRVRFFSSPHGAPLAARREHHDLVDHLIWFGCDYGPGDPLRWSPVSVEIVLADWVPAKIVADIDELELLPDVLRAFIAFSHGERGITAALTAETIEAVARWEPDFQAAIRSPEACARREVAELALGDLLDDRSYQEMALDDLATEVGGGDVLAHLNVEPLPDEEFVWKGLAADIRFRLDGIVGIVDKCCDELLSVEYRTCCRRILARAARAEPELFRRNGRDDHTAASVVWIAGKLNHLFDPGGMLVKDVMSWFGITQGSVSQKATGIRRAAGLPGDAYAWTYGVKAGDASLLISARRAAIIARRDRLLSGGY